MDATHDLLPVRRLSRGAFVGGILMTLLVHGALAALVLVFHVQRDVPVASGRDLMVTKLVKLGKPREKFWLPRIVVPPKAKAPEATIKVADDPLAPVATKEAPRPEDADVSKDLKRALERARSLAQANMPDEPAEGSLSGSESGTATEASAGDEYASQVFDAIRRNWVAPSGLISDSELAGLEADVRVSIGDDGTLLNARLAKSSGNQFFDDSCMQAIQATGKVPAPPDSVRAKFRRGLVLGFTQKDLAR